MRDLGGVFKSWLHWLRKNYRPWFRRCSNVEATAYYRNEKNTTIYYHDTTAIASRLLHLFILNHGEPRLQRLSARLVSQIREPCAVR
jgi:23S rRNA maturation mini-RNase III